MNDLLPIKVIVVDDFEPMRQSVSSMLEQAGKFQVIGHATDGLAAIEKAQELQPDLILLDIGVPKLSGIAAAPQIRKLAPPSPNRHPLDVETSSSWQ